MLTREQQLFRRSGLGGSDVAAVCGLSPFKRPIDVYNEKTAVGDVVALEPTNAQRFGSVLEPVVAQEYERVHGSTVIGPFRSMRVEARPWHLFTLDRLVLKPEPRGVTSMDVFGHSLPPADAIDRVLEIKTAGIGTARSFGEDGSDDLPEHIICQVAWYLAAVGVERADVAALINTSDYREFHVQRDPELEAYLLEEGEAFWRRVERREPPEPDGSDAFSKYLRDRFRSTSGNILPANPETDEAAQKLRRLRSLMRELEAREQLLVQRIKLAIGSADGIETIDCGRISYRHEKRGRIAYGKAFEHLARELNLDREYLASLLEEHRGEPARKFITPRKWSGERYDGDLEI